MAAMSSAGRAKSLDFSKKMLAELEAMDLKGLSRENQVDASVLRNQLRYEVWTTEQLQSWAWDPQGYNTTAGGALYTLVARDFAPWPERLKNATLRMGDTGYAESVRVTWDPKQVSYGQLLKVFFSVAHDPTQLNHQGPDHGTQYRSAIFYANAEQQRVAQAYIAQMTAAKTYGNAPIVTQVQPLSKFWPAEGYHQDFARLNPTHPYIVVHDAPKVARLKERYPALYRPQWTAQLAGAPSGG